jgi:PPP family 3-phenylpropionic acid transporter
MERKRPKLLPPFWERWRSELQGKWGIFWGSALFFLLFFGLMGIYIIRLPLYFREVDHLTPLQIGILFGAMPLAKFLTPFFFLHRPVNKKMVIIAGGVATIGGALLFTHFYPLLLLGFFLLGVAFSIIPPYVERRAVEELGHFYGRARLFGSVGFVLTGGLQLPSTCYLYLSFLLLLGAIGVALLLFHTSTQPKERGKLSLLKGWHFWVALILMKSAAAGYYSFFTIYLKEHNLVEYVGIFWGVAIVLEVLLFLFQPKVMSKISPAMAMEIALFATALRWFLLHFFPDNFWIVLFSQTLHATTFALFHMGAMLYLSHLYPHRLTLAQQFYGGLGYGLSFFLGSWLAGLLYSHGLFFWEGVFTLLALGVFGVGEMKFGKKGERER